MRWTLDPYWRAALEAALSLQAGHQNILVPDEFVSKREEFYPVKQALQVELLSVTGFVIPKDAIAYLPTRMLADDWFRRFRCVWANEVFVAYSALQEKSFVPDESIALHLQYFLEKREVLLRNSSPFPSSLPYLLDTQKNRLLQVLFPHQHFLMEQFEDLSGAPLPLQQAVLKYSITDVRLELSSYCNRGCEYCPVNFLNRKDKEDKIPWQVFEKCIGELSEIDYDGALWFCLFNEPLYDRPFLMGVLEYVNEHLPNCRIKIVTNGDYLTRDYLQELDRRKVDELTISVHYKEQWDSEVQKKLFLEILQRIGIGERGQWVEGDTRLDFLVDASAYDAVYLKHFSLRSEDFTIHGMDRGGILDEYVCQTENLDPCVYITTQLNISHDGKIVPCCNMCSDSPEIADYVYGDLSKEDTIFSAYTSRKAAFFRKVLFAPRDNTEETPLPCRTCSQIHLDLTEKLLRKDSGLRREFYRSYLNK